MGAGSQAERMQFFGEEAERHPVSEKRRVHRDLLLACVSPSPSDEWHLGSQRVSDVFLPQRNIFVLVTDSSFETQALMVVVWLVERKGLRESKERLSPGQQFF